MSHITQISGLKITDLDVLRAAVKRLGGTLIEGQKTYRWYGRWMGDSPMPAGMTKADLGKCDHAIQFTNALYEVGLAKQADGSYQLRYDWWNQGGLDKLLGQNASPLAQAYAVEMARKTANGLGQRILGETKLSNGAIRLELAGR